MRRKGRLSVIIILIGGGAFLFPEEVILRIFDRDLDFPLEGAQVRIVGEEETRYADGDGLVALEIPSGRGRTVCLVSYPGYDPVRLPLAGIGGGEIGIPLVLSGIIEGEELVVERTAPGEKEEETGVSLVLDREEMETTANIGLVEDVMSTVKTLPGVSFTGGWDAQPSIRGGYPEEMAASLDGFYVTYPFHWGGAYSIFNPNMVESAKLSHGIYSARYGRALSGILEITTRTPDEPELRVDGALSTTSADLFIQTPLGNSSGLFAGGKITYLDTAKLIYPDETEDMTTMPYIRDFYAKWQWQPADRVNVSLNGFLGSDGVGVDTSVTDDEGFTSAIYFDYDYVNSFLAGSLEWSPTDTLFIDLTAGANWNVMHLDFRGTDSGTREYSQEFLDAYGGILGLNPGDTYSLDGLTSTGKENLDLRQEQVKLTAEKLLRDGDVLVAGTEQVFRQTTQNGTYAGWYPSYDEGAGTFSLDYESFSTDVDGNSSWNPALFLIWEHGGDRDRFKSELGVRAEHYYIWNRDFGMHTRPAVNPRATVTWTAAENRGAVDSLDLTLGSGIFSYFPLTADMLEEDYGIDDWAMSPDRALFSILGTELNWSGEWKLSAETYYKYYLNRLVLTTDDGAGGDSELYYNTKGQGHVWGFDLMLQRKGGRKWDGYLSYSFIYARYYNPSNTGTDSEDSSLNNGEPLDAWFYPYYHRYHSLNLVFNWHFQPGWTFSLLGSLASGAPRERVGDVTVYPADLSGTWIEQYARTSYYSDSLRDGISVPVDLRLSYGRYGRNSKVYTEWYVAVEDIFVNLYQPSTNTSFNTNTGEENRDTSADFNIGVPIPSFGLKISY